MQNSNKQVNLQRVNSGKKIPTIEERNAAFNKMTPAQKRVAIAKDVIAQLNSSDQKRKINVTCGTYFKIDYTNRKVVAGEELQNLLAEPETQCSVCAKGAIFAVKVLNYNDYKLTESDVSWGLELDEEDMVENLKGIFTQLQLNLIENAFEQEVLNGFTYDLNFPKHIRAATMYHNVPDPKDRLRLIMHNIIENQGTFAVPSHITSEMKEFARQL